MHARSAWDSGLPARAPRCRGAPTPVGTPPATTYEVTACHPDYVTCISVKGDGSGYGSANDLDCGSIQKAVRLRRMRVDPYRLDADGDGIGCQSY
jgi:hypothetical protein